MLQDFSSQNLRGRSFKGQNLEGANFSYADIRGADFSGASLKDACLSGARAGLQYYLVFFIIVLSFFLSVIIGFISVIIGSYADGRITGITVFLLVLVFAFVTSRRGLETALWVQAVFGSVFLAVSITTIITNIVTSTLTLDKALKLVSNFALAEAGALAGTMAWILACATTLAANLTISKGRISELLPSLLAVVGTSCGCLIGTLAVARAGADADVNASNWAAFGAEVVVLISICRGWQILAQDDKFALIQKLAVTIAATKGTNFRGADLTNVNFKGATLKNIDFRNSTLTRTCFQQAKILDHIRDEKTYLQNPQVRHLLVTGQGQNQNFDHQDLRGVNLKGANLTDASFISADLSEANLQDANLTRAKLVQTQLDGTDFTGATLTGAFIEDWGITTDTKFDGVRCECIYMRLPTKENPDPLRKPDNNKEVFADGEFGDFIKPIFDTLDLYHNQGVDPRAIAISFKQLAENHPEADLRIVGMEVRGEDKFLLRAKTAITADKSQLSAEYVATYNEIKGLPEREIKLLLEEKDSRIRSLEIFVNQALQRPSFYSSTQIQEVGSMASNPGGFSVGGSVGGNVNNVQGDNNRAVQGDNNQAVLGDNNQVTQQNQVGADTGESLTKEDVVKLLAQLETLIQGAELPANTKEEVIEDLSAAKKATDKEEPNKQRALERLGSVAETLEKTSKGVEAGQKVWTIAKPIIVKVATWLGVAAGSHLLGL
ncbi:hypothetical protein CDG79_21955 [Nostoc sp. 'Peltigera membranacea cyanobiont' 232]|nr:hypothetical protein CDG79_21955 [Nostoc sp. 'Peltigera membranacea cyanobiont' 232]